MSKYFSPVSISVSSQAPLPGDAADTNESYFFGVMETIFVGWFTFIFVMRLLLAPDKVKMSLFPTICNSFIFRYNFL